MTEINMVEEPSVVEKIDTTTQIQMCYHMSYFDRSDRRIRNDRRARRPVRWSQCGGSHRNAAQPVADYDYDPKAMIELSALAHAQRGEAKT